MTATRLHFEENTMLKRFSLGLAYVRKQISKSVLGEAFAGFSHLRKPGRNHRPPLERSNPA